MIIIRFESNGSSHQSLPQLPPFRFSVTRTFLKQSEHFRGNIELHKIKNFTQVWNNLRVLFSGNRLFLMVRPGLLSSSRRPLGTNTCTG
ncbi:hypothetical protein R3I94_016432 [Phoxinus phoxinus]